MRIVGTPYEVAHVVARHTPSDTTPSAAETSSSGMDIARVSSGARARAEAPVDIDKVQKLKHELATEALSPNPTNIATVMLAEPSGDGR